MSEIWVRTLLPRNDSDIADGLQILRQAFKDACTDHQLRAMLESRNVLALFAGQGLLDDLPSSLLIYQCFPQWREINCVATLLDSTRQGLAKSLIQNVQQRAIESPAVKVNGIVARVPDWNVAAQLLFRSTDFECIESKPDYYGSGRGAYLFRWLPRPLAECGEDAAAESLRMD